MIDIDFKGYQEGIKIIAQLPIQMQNKMLRRALRVSAKPMLASARERAPRRTGTLAKMIRIVGMRRNRARPSEVAIAIKPVWSVGKKSGKTNQYYGLFIHEGTHDRKPRDAKALKFTGAHGEQVYARSARGVKATPFLKQAYDANEQNLINNFGQILSQEVNAFVAKNFHKV